MSPTNRTKEPSARRLVDQYENALDFRKRSMETKMANVLVVGGSRGIGASVAFGAARRGYDVAITYASRNSAARQVIDGIRGLGRRGIAIRADAAAEAETAGVFERVLAEFGSLDAMVYSAGISGEPQPLAEASAATMRRVLDVNLVGCMTYAREASRIMSTARGGQGGTIVLITSRSNAYGAPNAYVWYAASKAGVATFARGFAHEVGDQGIRVMAVSPGPIRTEMTSQTLRDAAVATTALGRAGEPDEVAEVVLFAMSSAASFVTGTEWAVSGGR